MTVNLEEKKNGSYEILVWFPLNWNVLRKTRYKIIEYIETPVFDSTRNSKDKINLNLFDPMIRMKL